MSWQQEVLDFWFGLEPEQWWKPDPVLDARIEEDFLELWKEQRPLPPAAFLDNAEHALAAIILFDQFPRNMFRGHADQFSTDPLALAIAKGAIERDYDERLQPPRRGFMLMPFQHSEDLEDQKRSVALFTALGDAEQLRYAKLHHDVIARFARFPHRNEVLGRAPRPAEVEAGDVFPW
ncbi:DUF924 family protein [Sphingosinicella rhizophila]|uniref:DUF924 family protein n=1 Tax=Sphingosinicella rhizophila TaxID=3050082 RepID=A0ABU3Q883_9SPHN|nr:DUF924 family protein [Sphingosinicella sp. GR2756]MDT9599609.1 DUF924 family protein [Sphingosinicella sp. GR2756]